MSEKQATRPTEAPTLAPAAPDDGKRSLPNSNRAQVLRHQQQRLLLLRHAAKCPHEDGKCTVTPHCGGMKRLWKHIVTCRNQQCQVPHCVSSRFVHSHYHRCKDVNCPVCGPVRHAIHRNNEKQKLLKQMNQNQMNQLKAGHNAALNTNNMPQHPQQQTAQLTPQQPQQQLSSQPQQQQPMVQLPLQEIVQPPNKRQRVDGNPPPIKSLPVPHVPPTQPQQPMAQGGTSTTPIPTASTVVQQGYAFPVPTRSTANTNTNLMTTASTKPVEKIQQVRTLQVPAAKLKSKCLEILKLLQCHQHGWVFNDPVDAVELGLLDYLEVIKHPMDLGTVKNRMENGHYLSLKGFQADVFLTFNNAIVYNPEGSIVYNIAKEMKDKFTNHYNNLLCQLKTEGEDGKRKNGDACAL